MLIDAGAELDRYNYYLMTPLNYAMRNGSDYVARMLIDNGVDVNITLSIWIKFLIKNIYFPGKSFKKKYIFVRFF